MAASLTLPPQTAGLTMCRLVLQLPCYMVREWKRTAHESMTLEFRSTASPCRAELAGTWFERHLRQPAVQHAWVRS